ncbi:MAG: hypoxanthine phosphoribosyltransferase [Phycisphaeraceae bacterium]|nr:MAG: hypoxanthine phosphoribosyltransferase [Phycisphaeraceae bacterium]
MFPEVDRVLVSEAQIRERVGELASEIARDLRAELDAQGQTLQDEDQIVFIPIMTGAMIFVADLVRQMPVKLSLDLVTVSSYPGETVTSKGAHLASDLPENLAGKHVVVLDDILDSGRTLALIKRVVSERKPASLRIAVLLDKKTNRAEAVEADYVGFEIPDEFVVGYGLDYNGYYRNHPEIAVLRPDAIPARDG